MDRVFEAGRTPSSTGTSPVSQEQVVWKRRKDFGFHADGEKWRINRCRDPSLGDEHLPSILMFTTGFDPSPNYELRTLRSFWGHICFFRWEVAEKGYHNHKVTLMVTLWYLLVTPCRWRHRPRRSRHPGCRTCGNNGESHGFMWNPRSPG